MTLMADHQVSIELAEKVDRYLIEGRCNLVVPSTGLVAQFRGDSRKWWTTRLFPDHRGECQCPAFEFGRPCVHTLVLARIAEDPR